MRMVHLEAFTQVAEAGSVSRAAEVLGVAQPTLSRQLAALARDVGAELFHRTPQGLRLTAAGREFLPIAEDLLIRRDRGLQAIRQVSGEDAEFTLGSPLNTMHYVLTPFIAQVHRTSQGAPGIRDVRTGDPEQTYEMLRHGEIDLAVGTSPAPAPFTSLTLAQIPLLVQTLIPPADTAPNGTTPAGPSPDAVREPTARIQELQDRRVVVPGYGSAVRHHLEAALRHCNVHVAELRSVSSASVAQSMAAHDPDLSAVVVEPSRFALHARQIRHHAELMGIQMYAVWDPGHYAAPALRRLAGELQDWMRTQLQNTLSWPAEFT